jgi:diguanylate cyclase (GGDEF)-like protein
MQVLYSSELNLTQDEKNFIKNNQTIKIALMPDFTPFSFIKNDRVVGFENDLLKLISQKTGLQFEKRFGIWNKNLTAFKEKKVDMITSISYKEERTPFTKYTTPYYNIPIMIFARDDFGTYEGLQSLKGKKVGILKDVFYANDIREHTQITPEVYETYDELTEALVFGKIDALIQNLPNINYLIKKNLYANLVLADELQLPGIKKEDLRFGINPNKPMLHSIIQKTLDSITEEEWDKITDKWLGVKLMYDEFITENNGSSISLTKEEKNYIQNNAIKIGMVNDYYPFTYKEDGKINGFSYEYFNLVASKVGLKFEIEIDNWSPTLQKFKDKKIDIIDAISYTTKRDAFTNFSQPYFEIPNVIFARKDTIKNYTGLESLKGKKVGITKGIYYFDTIKNLDLFELVVFQSSREKIKALALGKIDAAFNNLTSGQKYILQGGYANLQALDMIDESIVKKEDLRFGVLEENLLLHSILRKAMRAVSTNEKLKLINKYFGLGFQEKYNQEDNSSNKTLLKAKEKKYLESKQQIKMCVRPNHLPFSQITKDQKHKGISADIIEVVSNKINIPIQLVPTDSWVQSIDYFKSKKCDILPIAIQTKERQEYMKFTKPYIRESMVVATKEDQFFIKDSSELQNKKIAILEGEALIEILQQKYPNINIVTVENTYEGLQKVQSNEVFGYVDILPSIAYTMQQEGLFNLKIAGQLEFELEMSIASRKDEPILNEILQKALNDIEQSKIRGIIGKWISIKVEQSFDYTKLMYISLFFLAILLVVLYKNRSINKLNKQLKELSITDSLTQIYNRHKLEDILEFELKRANRYENQFGVIIMDIDFFKTVNDTYGHQVGDTVLKEFANILQSYSRKTDIVGRWGGEEFLIICTQTNKDAILFVANNLKKEIEAYPFSKVGQKTASFGVATYKKGDDTKDIIKRADDALYKAKRDGRNRVEYL